VGPLVEVLNEHLRAGKIRAFGGSNWTHQRLEEANAYAHARGLVPFVASSPHFSLTEIVQYDYPGVVSIAGPSGQPARDWYAHGRMPVLPWSSLSAGFLSGRLEGRGSPGGADSAAARLFGSPDNYARLARAREFGRGRGLSVPQVALAYLLSQASDVFPVVGPKRIDHFRQNAAALDLQLSPAEIAWLETGVQPGRGSPELPRQ